MLEQLTIFGTAEVIPKVASAPSAPAPEAPPALAAAVDPRQHSLFDGPLADMGALEAACPQLDVEAARAAWKRAGDRLPEWAAAQSWPCWLEDLAWLAGDADSADPALCAERASAVSAGAAPARFAGMSPGLRDRIARGALARAARSLVATRGPEARWPDGRPAGCLLLIAGQPEEAAVALAAAAAALPHDGLVQSLLGEAHWRCGRRQPALVAYAQACLIAPDAIDEAEVTCAAVLDLLDRACDLLPGAAASWVPVLADLEGLVSVLELTVEPPAGGPAAGEVVRLLRLYRRSQRGRGAVSDAAERLALKRAMLRVVPQLKELVRRL